MPSKRGPRERSSPTANAGHSNAGHSDAGHSNAGHSDAGRTEYDLMLQVERYESLAEDMEELGVATLDEVRQKVAELHRRLDAHEG